MYNSKVDIFINNILSELIELQHQPLIVFFFHHYIPIQKTTLCEVVFKITNPLPRNFLVKKKDLGPPTLFLTPA
jgi:hypothetical protein